MEKSQVNSPPIRVVIVDDHPLLRTGLRQLLGLEPGIEVLADVGNGQQALEAAHAMQPDVMLLDINLPDLNGIEITSRLKNERRTLAIVLLTAYDDDEQMLHALRAGAASYCPKDIEPDQLLAVIRQVARGNFVIGGKVYTARGAQEWLAAKFESRSGASTSSGAENTSPLSPREMEILRCVTRGLSNKEIAVELGISNQTVKNHMTSILDKLNVDDRTQAAVFALQRGWIRPSDHRRGTGPLNGER